MALIVSVAHPTSVTVAAGGEIPQVVTFLRRLSRTVHLQGPTAHKALLLQIATDIPGDEHLNPIRAALMGNEAPHVTGALAQIIADPTLHERLRRFVEANQTGPFDVTPPPPPRDPSPSVGVPQPTLWRPSISDTAITRAAARLAGVGEDEEPFRAAIELAFPEGTPEGIFLRDQILPPSWRGPANPHGFPITAEQFLEFLRTLLGNTAAPLGIFADKVGVDALDQAGRRTPAPVSATASPIGARLAPPTPRPLSRHVISPEGLEHFELAIHLIFHLERLAGTELIGGEPNLRERMLHFAEVLNATDAPLFLGNQHRVVGRIASLVKEAVAGTGTFVLATSYPVYGFRRQARHLKAQGFEASLRRHFTDSEMNYMVPALTRTPPGSWETHKIIARHMAAKRAVLRALGLVPEHHWLEVEAFADHPFLTGEAERAQKGRSILIASTVGRGDLGIGIALSEQHRGASGIERIVLDVIDAPPDFREPEAQRPLRERPRLLRFGEAVLRVAVDSGS